MARTAADGDNTATITAFSAKSAESEELTELDRNNKSKTMDFSSLLGTKQASDSRVIIPGPPSGDLNPAVTIPTSSPSTPGPDSASTKPPPVGPRVSFKELVASSAVGPVPPILITASSTDLISPHLLVEAKTPASALQPQPASEEAAGAPTAEPPGRPPPPTALMEGQAQDTSRDANATESVATSLDLSKAAPLTASPTEQTPTSTSQQQQPPASSSSLPASALELRPQTQERRSDFAGKRPYSFSGAFKDKASPVKWTGSFSAGTARGDGAGPSGAHLGVVSESESQPAGRRRTLGRRLNSSDVFERRLTRQRSDKEVLVGTPVKEGHVNYMLMYDMLTGIRISVSRCNAKLIRPLTDADFTAAHKLAFDVTGNEMTPSSKYDFKFKDYAPWVFRMIRESFHVDPAEYLLSLTGKYVLSELGSPGKSGSFFYYSQDYRFIIKTIHHSEHKFMRKILKHYYNHICHNPHTLISRIFGLHRVKLPGNRKIHFVVMGNVFPANKDIHETYDLKGSLIGRELPEEEAKTNPRAVLKDLNWLKREKKIELGPEKRQILVEQMERDVEFLKSQMIMDYSLLIGVHDLVKGNKDNIRDQTLA
ncbi:Phosphatidylinositol-4-phosphate 5-kinase, partial [Rhizophlyctis rosea]